MTSRAHLFAYGTLMCDDIMAAVSGVQPTALAAALPAIVHGYQRRQVKGEHYPAIIADHSSSVKGVIYQGIPVDAWARLDRFEGNMYDCREVQVKLSTGQEIAAHTYVIHAEFWHCLEQDDWDFETFLRVGKKRFRDSYRGYETLG